MEIDQVNRPVRSVTTLAAAALLLGMAVVGCAGHNGGAVNGPAGSPPVAQTARTGATEPPVPTPAPTATPADATPSAGSTGAPNATADPLDALLTNLDQLLNGLNGSLSGSENRHLRRRVAVLKREGSHR